MSCSNCKSAGIPNGCKNNGLCGTTGCNKLNSIDWLGNIEPPYNHPVFNIVEIRFKNARKEFYKNVNKISLHIGDVVVVEAKSGTDVGVVSLTGDLVKIQMNKNHQLIIPDKLPGIQRKASNKDIEKWEKFRLKELEIKFLARKMAAKLDIPMKISNVEYQGDGSKVIFYYSADARIDFRELVKDLATSLKVKIEMKQIGMRQEASNIGGIGSCGRELCCSTWLTDFKPVPTSAARYQQLSLNPEKLAGQCGKLKCCLNYELDAYMSALKKFPSTNVKLITEKGKAFFQKMDIFKATMTYSMMDDSSQFIEIPLNRVQEIIELNKQSIKVPALIEDGGKIHSDKDHFKNVVGQDSLTRFDGKKTSRKKKRKKYYKKNSKN